jgi:RNA polymerase sigma-70 factor (ECF subfamily)
MLVPEARKRNGVLGIAGAAHTPRRKGNGANLSQLDDTILIQEAQQGNSEAFGELVKHYDQAILRLTFQVTRSEHDAQDVYQDVFLRAFQNVSRFKFQCSFYTWIYRIAINLCIDHLRKRRYRREVSTNGVSPAGEEYDFFDRVQDERTGSNPERSLAQRELALSIGAALNRLSPRERVVFEMKHYQGLRLRTVAEILDTTEGTAKNILYRATQKLRLALADAR